MALPTSGTIGNIAISCGQIYDSAFRRNRILPQLVVAEHLDVAKRLLWMILSMLNNRGIALWVIDTQLLGLNVGQSDYLMPYGALALLNSNLRQIQSVVGSVSSTAGGGTIGNAVDGDLTTSCVQTAPNGNIALAFSAGATQLTQIGILPAATGTWNFTLSASSDGGVTWQVVKTVAAAPVVAGTWLWYDVDAQPAATNMLLQATNGTTLAVTELVCGTLPSDIPMSPLDKDQYTQLPNKNFQSRPTLYYFDRRIAQPIYHCWPTPPPTYPLNYLFVNYVQRQLQDVGTMAQGIELPDRWYLPVCAELARQFSFEFKEADVAQRPDIQAEADRLMLMAWNGESNGAPVNLRPNIGCYTR